MRKTLIPLILIAFVFAFAQPSSFPPYWVANSDGSISPVGSKVVKATAPVLSGLSTMTGLASAGTKFTISGCSAGTTVGGATAGQFASGTTGTCTVTITMNGATGLTAPNGWSCQADDITAGHLAHITQSATTATTCTVSGATTSGDTIVFHAVGY